MADKVIKRTLLDNKFKVEVYLENISVAEATVIERYGEPSITFGGVIPDSQADGPFSVPQVTRKLYSQMASTSPITYIFDADVDSAVQVNTKVLAECKAEDTIAHIDGLIDAAWAVLLAKSLTYTPETSTETLTPLVP